jgi:methyltransferase FkbM-like protein
MLPSWIQRVARLRRRPLTERSALKSLLAGLAPQDVRLDLIRVGGPHDGGYLIPDDLQGISACFSPGVGAIASFEAGLLTRGIRAFLADGTVGAPPVTLPNADFIGRNLGPISNETTITLDDWVASRCLDPDHDLLLQMDIEGAEFDCLSSASAATLRRFRIIVVEFHGLTRLTWRPFFDQVQAATGALLSSFDVVHLHPNNCSPVRKVNGVPIPDVLEVTCLRRDRGDQRRPVRHLPHPLDAKNDPNGRDVELSRDWFATGTNENQKEGT